MMTKNQYECGNMMDKLYTDTDIDPVYEDKLIKVTKQAINRKKIMEANVELTALKEKLKQEYHEKSDRLVQEYNTKSSQIGHWRVLHACYISELEKCPLPEKITIIFKWSESLPEWGYDVETIIEIDNKTYKSKDRKIGNLSMDADFLNERIQLQKILCMVKEPEKMSGIDTTTCFFPLFRQNASNDDYINALIVAGYKLINEDHGSPNIAYNCDKYELIRGNHE